MRVIDLRVVHRFILICCVFILALFSISFPASAECHEYDDLGRLISVTYDNTGTAKRSYELDKHGNRTTVDIIASGGGTCTEPNGIPTQGATGPITSYIPPPTNSPPVATSFNESMLTNAVFVINPTAHMSDPDGDMLTITSISYTSASSSADSVVLDQGANTISVQSNGNAGAVTITYVISDGSLSDSGIINVDVSEPTSTNTAPTAADFNAPMYTNTGQTIDLTQYISDSDGDALNITNVVVSDASLMTAVLNQDDSVTLTTNNIANTATVTYTVSDGIDIASGQITVVISVPPASNTPPVAGNFNFTMFTSTVSSTETQTLSPMVHASDADQGDTLSLVGYQILSGSSLIASSSHNPNDTISITSGFSDGTAVIQYTVSDGTVQDTGLITITIEDEEENLCGNGTQCQ